MLLNIRCFLVDYLRVDIIGLARDARLDDNASDFVVRDDADTNLAVLHHGIQLIPLIQGDDLNIWLQ